MSEAKEPAEGSSQSALASADCLLSPQDHLPATALCKGISDVGFSSSGTSLFLRCVVLGLSVLYNKSSKSESGIEAY